MVSSLNSLSKLIDFKFGKKEIGSVLGIDMGATSIKVVQLRKDQGVPILETYGEISLGPYANKEIGQSVQPTVEQAVAALADLLKESNTTTKDCGVSIPFSSSLISIIDMPKLDDKQLAKMIPIEARKYIPVPIGEVTLDWFVVPEEEGVESYESSSKKKAVDKDKVQVLLVAIHNEVLNQYRNVISGAGLKSTFFEIEIFSTIRAILGRNLRPALVIDIGATTTKLFVVELGVIKISHVINNGSQNITRTISQSLGLSLTKAEELKQEVGLEGGPEHKKVTESSQLVLSTIFSEVGRVLLQYQKRHNKNIDQVYLTGGGAMLKGMLSVAKKHLEIEVTHGDPFSKIESPAFLEDVLKGVGPEFTVAIGIALRKLQEDE